MKDFIKSLKRPGNESLIEAVLEGYDAIFETFDTPNRIKNELIRMGANVEGGYVTLYRGGNVSSEILKNLRYGDFLSTVKTGNDAYGNAGASGYGKNVISIKLPISDIVISNGEIQYKGTSNSLHGSIKYPIKIYKAYNDYYGSNYTAKEIDKQDNVRSVASMGLSGGKEEFDDLLKQHINNKTITESFNKIKGGKADKKKPSDVDPEQLKMGIKIEHEHTNDKKLAEEIAMDHLTEFPNYYTELKKMETKLEKENTPTDPEQVKMGDEVLERVFVYETLLDKNLRKKLFKRDVKSKKAILPDYTEVDEGKGYHTISYSKGSVVKGEILFVTESEMKMLDDWEDRYNRTEETLESGEKAWAYVEKKKYIKKSLNEAIGPVYHGTNDKFEKFDLDKTTMGDIWFSSNKEIIERGESGARGTKYIMERYLNIPEEKLAGWDLYEKRGLCELKNMGYRGVKLPSEEGIDYIVFNPKDIIKKPKNIMEAIGPVYHGSPNKFDRFSYEYMGKIGTSEGYGFYFTTDKEIAEKYTEGSGNLYTAYLDINKPLNPTKKTITKTQLVKFIKALDPTGQDYLSNWGDVEHEGYNNTLRKAVDTEYKYNNNDVDLISSIINADGSGPENVYSILTKTLGYDGIVAQPDWVGGGHKIVIPFSPDQIKLV